MARDLTAKSFVLDLLSTLRRGAMPVRALVDAARIFGIAPGSVRVTLSRLLAAGLVESDERGHYRLGASSAAVQRRVGSWRRLEERVRPWDGGWVGVLGARGAAAARSAQRRSERALRLLGCRPFERGLALRPDNLAGGVAAVRDELAGLGLEPGALVFALRDLDPVSEARARTLWDADALVASYRSQRAAIEASAARLGSLSPEQAMVESFRAGGEVLRQLVLDPLLPEPILPAAERTALVDAMRRYDALGRAAWADFLARYDVPHRSAPADTRVIARGGLA